jgi:hypothetical protein
MLILMTISAPEVHFRGYTIDDHQSNPESVSTQGGPTSSGQGGVFGDVLQAAPAFQQPQRLPQHRRVPVAMHRHQLVLAKQGEAPRGLQLQDRPAVGM